jgi:hypothetical protein
VSVTKLITGFNPMELSMSEMSQQEILQTVATHLAKQGKRAVKCGTGTCMYRGPNDTKCALGPFIPDATYTSSMEGKDVRGLISDFGDRLPGVVQKNLRLFKALQLVHDTARDDDYERMVRYGLNVVAESFGLTAPRFY